MARPTSPAQTPVDYVTIVLSPVLIMGLVGSLVFFLLEVFYRADGPFKERLQWILFFYVFGSVLVARISMNAEIASRFWMYGLILALAAFLGMQAFIEYPAGLRELSVPVNFFLITVVWWCTHRLTWDCTNVDEDVDMSGEGVLQAAGLDQQPPAETPEVKEGKKERLSWWQRWERYREARKKKRTLGVWVVYFSLAALPIFGLGQSLIPLTAPERRGFTFWLMTVYVACGLGLLLTTCFLGLRRYLRQKRLQMPATMTGVWLTSGATLVVALLVLGALLPRPHAEYGLRDLVDPVGSAKRKASKMALKGDSPGEGRGDPGATGRDGKEPGGQTKEKGKAPGQDKDKGSGKGDSKDGQGKSDSSQGKSDSSGKQNKGDSSGKQNKGDSSGKQNKGDAGEKGQKSEQRDGQKDNDRRSGGNQTKNAAKGMDKMQEAHSKSRSSSPRLASLQEILKRVGPWLKWIVFAVMAVLVCVAVFRGALGFLANFTSWAKRLLEAWNRFWANLFGGRRQESAGDGEEEAGEQAEPPVPFSAFRNPFDSGKAERMTPRQLVRYSFEALEAWSREHDLARRDDETAQEFVDRVGNEIPGLETEAQRLAQLLARAEYAQGELPSSTAAVLRGFWERLERVALAPLSA
jgi:hypothetical protein